MKKERTLKKRMMAWLLTLAMVMSLVTVPAGEVKAADVTLSVKNGFSSTSVTIAKNEYGNDYIGDVLFDVPSVAESQSQLSANGITQMEVKVTIRSFTAGIGNPSVMLYVQPGADGNWAWNASEGVTLEENKQITLTYNFSGMDWNGGSTMGNLGLRFANCADGSTVAFTIDSAKLIGGSVGSSGSDVEEDNSNTSGDVTAKVSKNSGDANWAEYNYAVTNGTDSAISGIKIKIPFSGAVNDLKSWGCTATKSGNYIVISHSAVLEAGASYSCIGSSDIKFGFAGGATLGTPVVEFVYGESGTSSSELKYELTGKVKNVASADTPFGKHGELNLATVNGYTAPIIVDKNGNPFQLRGASTHGMHWNEMKPYVNKGAFQSLRDEWGVNMVRLVSYVTQGGYTAGSKDSLDASIQTGVAAATELGMYVIIDWHIHAENPHTTKSQAEEFFRKYATMYKDYDNVIFEICNEPTGVEWYNGSGNDLYSYCKDIATIIRDCGSDALIVCGTNTWSQDVEDVSKKPLKNDGFDNILYTFHFYAASHYADLMGKVRTATAAGTPIFVTEFGVCSADGNGTYDTANADAWIQLLDGYNISYACWSLCNKNEAASYLKPSCTKTTGGWLESDLSTTGIWLVNTYRAHEEAEGGNSGNGSGDVGNEDGNGGTDSGDAGSEGGNDGSGSGDAGSDSGNGGSGSGDAGSDSGNGGSGSGDAGSDNGNSGNEGGNGGADSGDDGSDSGNDGADSGDAGSDNGNGGTDSGDAGSDNGNGGTDSGNGGSGDVGSEDGNGESGSGDAGSDSGNGGSGSEDAGNEDGNDGSGDVGSEDGNDGTDSGDVGNDSENDGADSGDAGSDNGNGGSDSGNGGSDNGNGGSDNGNGGSDNGTSGTDNGNGGSDNGNGGSDSGNGGSDNGNGGTDNGNGGNNNEGKEEESTAVAVQKIKITGPTRKVAPGKRIQLAVVVSPANATNAKVTWKVDKPKYASVDANGVVKTKSAGKGKKITVTAISQENNEVVATYKISIMKKAVKKIKLSAKSRILKVKKSMTIKAKFTPSSGISKELTWTSSNPKIATVNKKGKVVGKRKGKVKITARAKDGSNKKASITIQVK